ncbi:hypothetical protein DFH06DRAFT_953365, partial [Mycena polygramma]
TTPFNDTTVAAVLLMATLKQYYQYGFCMSSCGIPRVTLEGEKADWEDILGRLEKLKEYGVETIAWYHLLHPVIVRFVAAYDEPDSKDNINFWNKVVHHHSASGYSYYSGWINAFIVFNKEGKWLGHKLDTTFQSAEAPETMHAARFWATYSNTKTRQDLVIHKKGTLLLDGTPYHRIDRNHVPLGFAEVDVDLIQRNSRTECVMVAGMIGTRISSSGDTGLSEEGKDDTVRPVAGWWMFKK